MRAFIAATPETPRRPVSASASGWRSGPELRAARDRADAGGYGSARHARASATWLVDLAAGSPGDLAALRSTAAALDDPDERLEADVEVAVDAARVEVAAGRDWKPPLVAIRGVSAPNQTEILWRHTWRPAFRGMFVAAVIGVAAFWFFLPAS